MIVSFKWNINKIFWGSKIQLNNNLEGVIKYQCLKPPIKCKAIDPPKICRVDSAIYRIKTKFTSFIKWQSLFGVSFCKGINLVTTLLVRPLADIP